MIPRDLLIGGCCTIKTNRKIKFIITLSVTILLCLMTANILVSYFTTKKAVDVSVANNALEMAKSIAETVDVEAYERFLENPERNQDYWEIRQSLYEAKQHTAALYVYTLAFEDRETPPKVMITGFPRDGKHYYDIGMDCVVPVAQIQMAYEGRPYFTGKIKDPHYGEYVSAGAPIRNKQGQVIGFLSIDIETTLLDRISDTAIRDSIFSLIYSGLFVIVLLTAFVLMQGWYQRELKKQIGETEETYHSEIQSLIQSVRSLRHDFANHIQILNGLLKLGKHKEALDYSDSMREEAQLLYKIPTTSSNPALSVLFQTKTLSAQSHNITIEFHNSEDDYSKIQTTDLIKLLSNLIDNAIEAASEQVKEDRKIEVRCESNTQEYVFSITNTGPTITMEQKEKIFTPGYSTKKRSMEKEIRGQGLFIVKQIIEKYNGRITIDSEEGLTTFTIKIPQ
ncbi:sensor histidine kinase [Bacillus sp. AK031]